jgi:UDP-N-acetyl-D-mannosaminuronate dehydrogenase
MKLRNIFIKGMLVVLESTTYPGTTEEVLKPLLEESGLVCGEDFFLAYSPERVDPGYKHYNTKNTPKVVGGVTPTCTLQHLRCIDMCLKVTYMKYQVQKSQKWKRF